MAALSARCCQRDEAESGDGHTAIHRPGLLPLPDNFAETVATWEAKKIPFAEAIRQCGMSEATFYRRLWKYRPTKR
ncbi:MAG: hypothetical protein IJV40_15090 [Oscillospiraceae bacterium]|nr:hypothetical protein [Oscillospiraceae bacterium]